MTAASLKQSLDQIAKKDADVRRELKRLGYPEPRKRPRGFETFFRIIVSQQISAQAARSILAKAQDMLGETSAEAVHKCRADRLRKAGLSARKVEYAKDLARAIVKGEFSIEGLAKMENEQAIQAISSLRGFGRWSAEVYLMFSLGRPDIFASGDLALRVAVSRLRGYDRTLTEKEAHNEVMHWSPHRTAGCVFLWHYYRGAPQ